MYVKCKRFSLAQVSALFPRFIFLFNTDFRINQQIKRLYYYLKRQISSNRLKIHQGPVHKKKSLRL